MNTKKWNECEWCAKKSMALPEYEAAGSHSKAAPSQQIITHQSEHMEYLYRNGDYCGVENYNCASSDPSPGNVREFSVPTKFSVPKKCFVPRQNVLKCSRIFFNAWSVLIDEAISSTKRSHRRWCFSHCWAKINRSCPSSRSIRNVSPYIECLGTPILNGSTWVLYEKFFKIALKICVCCSDKKNHWFHGGKYSPLLITIQCNWHLLVLSI